MIEKFTVSRDDHVYHAWPDVALTPDGRLVCVFSECTHHLDRSYTRIMLCDSTDRGRTWTPKRPLSEPTRGKDVYWNCARITPLRDGRLVVIADKLLQAEGRPGERLNYLFFSHDGGRNWTDPELTPARGIVPDKLLELPCGRWMVSCHSQSEEAPVAVQRAWWSDDHGTSWNGPSTVARQEGLKLCEASLLPMPDGRTLVAFMRENSLTGMDCYKTISHDAGEHWSEPIRFPLPGCHRPVAGWLQSGHIMITHRFMHGGKGWSTMMQNFFAALTDRESALALTRNQAWVRILPVDFDRSSDSDLGYSGWVQFDDGEIYIVNYIVDDAPKGQIRGYALSMEDFVLPKPETEADEAGPVQA